MKRKRELLIKSTGHMPYTIIEAGVDSESPTIHRTDKRVGRNDLCPCGSGKKAKNCCGTNAVYETNKFRLRVTPENRMKRFRNQIPFEVGEVVLASKAFPVESFRGKELVIVERGLEEHIGNFYFKIAPVSDPEHLVKTDIWYSDGHLVKPEHYDQD